MQNTDRKSLAFFVPPTTPRPAGTQDLSNAYVFTLHLFFAFKKAIYLHHILYPPKRGLSRRENHNPLIIWFPFLGDNDMGRILKCQAFENTPMNCNLSVA
jgi:hypothetical protein